MLANSSLIMCKVDHFHRSLSMPECILHLSAMLLFFFWGGGGGCRVFEARKHRRQHLAQQHWIFGPIGQCVTWIDFTLIWFYHSGIAGVVKWKAPITVWQWQDQTRGGEKTMTAHESGSQPSVCICFARASGRRQLPLSDALEEAR